MLISAHITSRYRRRGHEFSSPLRFWPASDLGALHDLSIFVMLTGLWTKRLGKIC
jgi:hypothetical protein